ncbi:MAG: signal peptide peptidase SppA, partial [Methanococcaceae archaeon]
MKQFFKFMFASMLGTFLVILLFAFIAFIVFAAAIAGLQSETSKSIAANSVLELKLDYQLQERAVSNPFAGFALTGFRINRRLGLNEVIDNIRKAQFDSDIRGIYLNLNNFLAGGLASVEAIRNQLIEFKKSGKFIYAYGNDISQKAFYLASAADRIYLSPEGSLDFKGLSAELVFFKQTLEKLEIKPQIFQYGKFKSAVEPLKLDKMSPENRTQTEEMLNSIYTNMLGNISKSKNIEFSKLDDISKNMLIRSSADARKYNFVDSLIYFDEVINIIKQKINFMKSKPLKFVSMEDYNLVEASVSNSSENKIALIYADGEIGSGEGNETTIGTENISDAIRKARMDAGVKAIVMRVNSPGGDALTSDLIWREVTLARKEKPFIVSMGNVAASGGYYISCAADTIVAEPTTITGSIGVFGIINNMESFFKNKLGITFDRVKTGKYSDIGTMSRPLAQEEKV